MAERRPQTIFGERDLLLEPRRGESIVFAGQGPPENAAAQLREIRERFRNLRNEPPPQMVDKSGEPSALPQTSPIRQSSYTESKSSRVKNALITTGKVVGGVIVGGAIGAGVALAFPLFITIGGSLLATTAFYSGVGALVGGGAMYLKSRGKK